MKIVYCIPSIHNSGGMERILFIKASWLVEHGHQVTIITTDNKDREAFFEFSPKIRFIDLGINYPDHIHNFAGKLLKSPILLLRHKTRLTKALVEICPDITISMFNAESAFLWKLRDGSKKIVEIHFARSFRMQGTQRGIWGFYNRWRSAYDLRLMRHYDRFVVLTHTDAKAWDSLSNMQVIHNPVTFQINEAAPLEAKQAIAVGRFAYQKGFDTLIDLWQDIARRQPDWTLHIYGNGDEKTARDEQILRCGLSDRIILHPATAQLPEIMCGSSIFCFSSRFEGFGLVLAEAMECGVPCVSFDCPCGPSEIIRHGEDGFLVPAADTAAFAESVEMLMNDPALRKQMGKRAKENIRRFSLDSVMQQWQSLFEELKR